MSSRLERISATGSTAPLPLQVWIVTLIATVSTLAVSSLAYPRVVYEQLLWRHVMGPIYARGRSGPCAVWSGGSPEAFQSASACRSAGGTIAWTRVSTIEVAAYALLLMFLLVGVVLLLRWLDVGGDNAVIYGGLPYYIAGGELLLLSELSTTSPAFSVPYPISLFLVFPLVYGTMLLLILVPLLAAVSLVRRGSLSNYYRPWMIVGFGVIGILLGYLASFLGTTAGTFHPVVPAVVLGATTTLAVFIWAGVVRIVPSLLSGTGAAGLVVLWGYILDGVNSVVAVGWATTLGLSTTFTTASPIASTVRFLMELTLPAQFVTATGTAWLYLTVRILVALGLVWVFDEDVVEVDPLMTNVMLAAVLAFALVPAVADLLRLTFGV